MIVIYSITAFCDDLLCWRSRLDVEELASMPGVGIFMYVPFIVDQKQRRAKFRISSVRQ